MFSFLSNYLKCCPYLYFFRKNEQEQDILSIDQEWENILKEESNNSL